MAKVFTNLRFKLDRTQKKVIVYILAITLPLFLFSLYFIQNTASRELAKFSEQKAFHIDTQITMEIEHYLNSASAFTQEASYMLKLHPKDYASILPFLKKQVRDNANIYGSALALEPSSPLHISYCKYFYKHNGIVKEKMLMPPAYKYREREWYRKVKETPRQRTWSKPYFDKGGGNAFMSTFSYPLLNKDGDFLGVVTADVQIDVLSRKIQKMTLSKEHFVFILDKKGFLLSHPDKNYALKQNVFNYAKDIHSPTLLEAVRKILKTDHGTYSATINSEEYTLHSANVPNSDLKIIVFLKNTILFKPLHDLKQKLSFIALAGIALILVMIIVILREFKQDIVQKTKMKDELELAKKIQMSFLPEAKDLIGRDFEIHAYLKAAKEVGGDLYGYQTLENCIVFYVGDVSGKGIPAALFMMATQIVLENCIDTETDPAEIISLTNAKLLNISKNSMFVTLLVIRYDFTTHTLTFCNAGHPGFMVKTNRLFSPLGHIHPPVNTFRNINYRSTSLVLNRSFHLICFSDGVTEAENSKRELFGTQRVAQSLAAKFELHTLLQEIDLFVKNNPANDDMTVLVFKA